MSNQIEGESSKLMADLASVSGTMYINLRLHIHVISPSSLPSASNILGMSRCFSATSKARLRLSMSLPCEWSTIDGRSKTQCRELQELRSCTSTCSYMYILHSIQMHHKYSSTVQVKQVYCVVQLLLVAVAM